MGTVSKLCDLACQTFLEDVDVSTDLWAILTPDMDYYEEVWLPQLMVISRRSKLRDQVENLLGLLPTNFMVLPNWKRTSWPISA